MLALVDTTGKVVSESQFSVLNAARCGPDTPAQPRADYHHEAVQSGIREIVETQRDSPVGGALGRPSGARFRTYERLKDFAADLQGTLFESLWEAKGLSKAIEEIYRFPLRPTATDTLNRWLKAHITDEQLAELVCDLRAEDRLCIVSDDTSVYLEPKIICSMGLKT